MKDFKTIQSALRTVKPHMRAPFSCIVRGKRMTCFYYGGWNALIASQCMEFPTATYLIGINS